MSQEIHVPALPESVADATVVALHKKVGDTVERDEPLLDLETDKVVLEVPAPQAGVLERYARSVGDVVKPGELLAVIDDATTEPQQIRPNEQSPVIGKSGKDKQTALSPAALKLVHEHNIDTASLDGSGKDGRITKQDVLKHLQENEQASQNEEVSSASKPPEPEHTPPATHAAPSELRGSRREPMSRLRLRIAERLQQAQRDAAILTTFNEVNMQAVMEARGRLKDEFERRYGIRLGLMSFFIKACTHALQQFPIINASIDGKDIVYHDYYDIGIAVSSPRGLVVPVLRDADQASFGELEQSIMDFATRAKEGKLEIDDLTGGTFSITNGGVFGSMLSTPLLNPPQSAILGMHNIQQRPVVENGEIVARPVMYLALSYDHRLIDGRDAVQFLVSIKQALEDPARLLVGL